MRTSQTIRPKLIMLPRAITYAHAAFLPISIPFASSQKSTTSIARSQFTVTDGDTIRLHGDSHSNWSSGLSRGKAKLSVK